MAKKDKDRKSLDNKEFIQLRQATGKISSLLDKRLKDHLSVLKPLFIPRKLLGTYVKSSQTDEVSGSDKAFAELQERYAAVCEKPFGLPKKLSTPLPAISNQLEGTPFKYPMSFSGGEDKEITITSPVRWILSFSSECPLDRLLAMISGQVTKQPEEMQRALVDYLAMGVFLKHYPALTQILQDLRYEVETREMPMLGNLPVVVLKAPPETFLPPDDFILQVTQLSGIPAFMELVDPEAVKSLPDPLVHALTEAMK